MNHLLLLFLFYDMYKYIMAQQYLNVLSDETIVSILSLTEVNAAKERVIAKTSNTATESFSIPLTTTIRSELYEHLGLQLSNVSSIPMRWIKGDTPIHQDNGINIFTHTHIVYLTSSPGNLVVDGIAYPITRGYGYIFSEGLSHETVGTEFEGSEPRLLLGPMSETGFAVGGSTILNRDGNTKIYLRQTAIGQNVQYSTDQMDWNLIEWPLYLNNTNTSLGLLEVNFITDITIDINVGSGNGFIVCNSASIQIGSRVLKEDGTRPVITIDGITNYQGFIRNGLNSVNGYNNVYVMNLEVRASGATYLVNGGGWLGQGHFGNNTTASSNVFINCHSTGIISNYSGGIVGHYSGPVKCVGCSSAGMLHEFAGGIVGSNSPSTPGLLHCESCWSSGLIGHFSGGITGESTRGATIQNCYSTGAITENAGGISGRFTGGSGSGSEYTVSECYSTGPISDRAGGIVGSETGLITISNCYSTGPIVVAGGCILGFIPETNTTNKSISNCYSTGTTEHPHGYIVSNFPNVTTNITVGSGTITLANNYSEAANSTTGWNNTHANTVLTGVPVSSSAPVGTKWVYTGSNTPYELYNMGYTPYTRTMITGTTPGIVRSFSSTLSAGNSSSAAIVNEKSYTILQITGGTSSSYGTITMNNSSGIITTTNNTIAGVYTITLRNNGSYHITVYELTVTEAPPVPPRPYNPCRFFGLFTDNAQVYYKSHSLGSGGVGSVRNYRKKVRRT